MLQNDDNRLCLHWLSITVYLMVMSSFPVRQLIPKMWHHKDKLIIGQKKRKIIIYFSYKIFILYKNY